MDTPTLIAVLLGILEAGTEFLPVSSTGHLLLVGHFLGFESTGKVFEVAIQLGAILAICVLYFRKLWGVALHLPCKGDEGIKARAFATAILVAFAPAVAIGFFAHEFIKTVLFNPWVVCISLIVGGFLILLVERIKPSPTHHSIENLGWKTSLKIGLFQCLAMVPGVSRSGATIMGALMLRVDRITATEFSFFLSIPTMVAAVGYDLFKNRDIVAGSDMTLIAIGFTTAFIVALFVVKWLVSFVGRHGFTLFAYWRLVVGMLGLAGLIYLG